MSAMREKDASDYDLERFVEMFDEALTSDDPRVKNALRQLMMMVILTSGEHEDSYPRDQGPLRRMQQDLRDMITRTRVLEEQLRKVENEVRKIVNQPPSGYSGIGARGLGGPGWPNSYDSTTYGQAIGNPAITNNAISAAEYWNQAEIKAKYDAQMVDEEFAKYIAKSMSKEWSKKDA